MESEGTDPKAAGETYEHLLEKVDAKYPFKPTDEELLTNYLKRKILGEKIVSETISEVDIYKYEPWDLPALAKVKNEASPFYFFCPMVQDRATESGYWKTLGRCRDVMYKGGRIGFKQLLTYCRGKPPTGEISDWKMYEYSLDPILLADHQGADPSSFVLCWIFDKSYNKLHPDKHPIKAGNTPGSSESISSLIQGADASNVAATRHSSFQHNLISGIGSFSDYGSNVAAARGSISEIGSFFDNVAATRGSISEFGSDLDCCSSVAPAGGSNVPSNLILETSLFFDYGFNVADARAKCAQSDLKLESDPHSDFSLSKPMDISRADDVLLPFSESVSSDQEQGIDDFSMAAAGGSCVQSDLKLERDSYTDLLISELTDISQADDVLVSGSELASPDHGEHSIKTVNPPGSYSESFFPRLIQGADSSSVAAAGGSSVQDNLISEIGSFSDYSSNVAAPRFSNYGSNVAAPRFSNYGSNVAAPRFSNYGSNVAAARGSMSEFCSEFDCYFNVAAAGGSSVPSNSILETNLFFDYGFNVADARDSCAQSDLKLESDSYSDYSLSEPMDISRADDLLVSFSESVSSDQAKVTNGLSVAVARGSCVQSDLKLESDSYTDLLISELMDISQADDQPVSCSEPVSSDQAQRTDGFRVEAAGDPCVQNEVEIGSDSESDSSISELMDMFQKSETELVHNISTSSVQPNMYVDGLTHLGFLSAPVAWERLRGRVGDVIDSPKIKPLAQQVVASCHNSPLITSLVGSALTAESNPFEWQLAAQRLNSLRISDTDDSLNPCIRYCYDRLKDHDVKTCFLYSALVLKNKQIHISVLVKYFITEGLLGGATMAAYKRANDIVGLLVKASLLEASNETMMVNMHYTIRDSALEILSSSTEGCQMFLGRGLGKLGAEQVDKYLIKIGDQRKEPPPPEEWEQATAMFLMDNDFSTLPSKPYCPTLVSLFLQRNRYLRVVPASFFDSMHSLTNLNLSQTRIRSLPDSLFTLKSLQVLLLRYCEHLFTLPSEIGQLTALQVLDLQGTELLNLPDTINELASLKSLKVSFYGSINISEYNNLPRKLIGDGIISNLPLQELGMFVHPGDRRWTISVSDITKEVSCLLLTTLYFHFPELESLEYFLQGSQSWNNGNLTDFNFIVGHDFKHALSLVTRDAELMHSSSKPCLRFVNGETIPQGVVEVLKRATSLYLDHHFSICFLSEFGIDNMDVLKVCILSDCPVVQAIIDLAEDGQVILPSLEYLSLNSLWNLEAIISSHHFLAEESFHMLTFLSLRACPKLTYVFTLSMLKNLPKLEELLIEDCVSLEYIFCQEDLLGSDEFAVLPCLKVLKLYYLPNLCELGRLTWVNVEYMHFYNCRKLKSLCMTTTDDTGNIKEITADKAWWDSLEWDEPLLSERLDKLFTQIQLDDL